ncbi:phage integrase central domain-containing protein [Variovorax sp. RB2P76]|uniref:phage integrase central domain-containing protein n=1 Tax=Variovorax sp. RB2P76 TaxID=3443736 RepID=UPI003F48F574
MKTHLEADVVPLIGTRPVAEVTVREMTAMLEKIKARGATYTASRQREVWSQVFRFAVTRKGSRRTVWVSKRNREATYARL